MHAVLEKYPDINVLTEVNGNWDQASAQQVVSNSPDLISRHVTVFLHRTEWPLEQ